MPTIDEEIRSKLEAFAEDIGALVRRAALEAVSSALGSAKPAAVETAAPARRARAATKSPGKAAGRGRGQRAKKAAPPRATSRRAASASRRPGAKRPPGELVKLTDKLGDYIAANPGRRMESIAKALGKPTRELNLPVKKLLAAKKIRSEGQKRATEYYPV